MKSARSLQEPGKSAAHTESLLSVGEGAGSGYTRTELRGSDSPGALQCLFSFQSALSSHTGWVGFLNT